MYFRAAEMVWEPELWEWAVMSKTDSILRIRQAFFIIITFSLKVEQKLIEINV